MSSPYLSPAMHEYLLAHCTLPDRLLRDLVAETREATGIRSEMLIAPDQGMFLSVLTTLLRPSLVVEVGTFTGYSSICFARAMPAGGRLIAFDVSEEWTTIARKYWERAGVADRIELRLGPAATTLKELPPDPVIDLAFIDADKQGYPVYFEELVPRVRPGGAILIDNVLWDGKVADPGDDGEETWAIREFNDAVAADPRVSSIMMAVGDGFTLCVKH
ncbi:caffeoyl-CoA O-methyltransferase [Streptosporangium becharense]|uniref:Caffeoyl-CoA O-methyltransferase n=1 Tax=Streptosporangium becharense TaxID=1816182 RepID=A0A7W9IM07_9ACTN|nr:class I SAM-dependent methyltransferase [Streptosporangium becharense]MBB2910384.1 caffeoyl-CoA O-methyltransferase [Streptosporangium becharense]MBB5823127.1 caffeoyl-CoA O-methyltransferase [Streptosporangium becharense]